MRVGFDEQREAQLESEIEMVTREITRLFSSAGNKVKRIASATGAATADAHVRKNLQRALAAKLQDASRDFRTAQKAYLAELNQIREGASFDMLTGSSSAGPGTDLVRAADFDLAHCPRALYRTAFTTLRATSGHPPFPLPPLLLLLQGFSDQQLHELAEAEDLTEQRDREIQQIARSIEELAVMFKDLATLIVDQGTMLDRIDANMEMVVQRVQGGVKELETAERYQKSARPVKCIIFLMLLITVLVIIIIVQHS